ncbi:MAG: hypothetical protein Q4F95_07785 [Oscillospiraceae bacterium]|nr:hypothetical protein [Oscillospiraceae bacterium]
MTNITSKQIVTLVVLVMVLFMVIVGQYMVRPVLTDAGELNKKSEKLEIKYEDMQSQALLYEVDNQDNINFNEQIAKEKENLLPVMKNSELDKIVTKMVVASGLSVLSLDIGQTQPFTIRIPYKPVKSETDKDNEKKDPDDVSVSETDDDVQTNEDGIVLPDPEKYPGAEFISDDFGNYFLEYKTGEYSCELCYNLTGRYEDIQKLLKKVSENKAMSIGGISFENCEQLSETCQYKAVISVIVYMYDELPDL